MPRKPPQVYDVVRSQDGALVVRDVPLNTARSECARLCAEAKVKPEYGNAPYAGMFHGELVTYEVRGQGGLAIPGDAKAKGKR